MAAWLRGHGPETLIGGILIAVTTSVVGAVVTGMFDTGGDDDKPPTQATRVLVWAQGKVKEGPIAKSKNVTTAKPGNYYTGMCWTAGDKVTYREYSNDKWVRLQLPDSRTGYISAIFLKGNDQGGVPNEC
ncbi:SH3 domain-containing protein [Wenjunlia tyrosinilytica]|nr:SH3 domain-containing protein [Wenjunlia tyrosinilytica]